MPIKPGLRPSSFGPCSWAFSSSLFKIMDKFDPKRCYEFIRLFALMLCCKHCRQHFHEFIENNPPEKHITCRKTLAKWFNKAHNNVNKINGKPIVSFRKHYATFSLVGPYIWKKNLFSMLYCFFYHSPDEDAKDKPTCDSRKTEIRFLCVLADILPQKERITTLFRDNFCHYRKRKDLPTSEQLINQLYEIEKEVMPHPVDLKSRLEKLKAAEVE